MKKIVIFAVAVLFLFASTAMAESIAGKVGITARGGASYILSSEFTDEGLIAINSNPNRCVYKDLKRGIGWDAGGGIIYGITDNLAVNFDVIYSQADVKMTEETTTTAPYEYKLGKGSTIDFALGVQWRFMPKSSFVPYIGAGFDIMMNRINIDDEFGAPADVTIDVATTYGGHLSVGADFFITPNIALNAEIRGLYSTKGDMTAKQPGNADFTIAKYNPSNVSGFLGIRFFF